MALQKNFDLENGFAVQYWRIVRLNIDALALKVEITLYGYKDQVTRDGGGAPADTRQFNLEFAVPSDLYDSVAAAAYALVKSENEFNDALDV